MYDLLVFIGRFQPLHLGHQVVIDKALTMSKRVLVLVGGKETPVSVRNPFSFLDRYNLIKKIYPTVSIRGINDHTYNDTAWVEEVQKTVKEVALGKGNTWTALGTRDLNIGLIGCNKDHSSYYLKLFPEWKNESVEFLNPLNATDIRNKYFEHQTVSKSEVSLETFRFLGEFWKSPPFAEMLKAYNYLKDYKVKYGEGPHLTADALVQVGGNILVIKRGKEYGYNQIAMPGGFVNKGEKFLDAAIRELREETRLKVPIPVLKGSIKNNFLADDPYRSDRGRLVSSVYHIKLENDITLPEVRGGDDASEAFWLPISDIGSVKWFEDHYHIVKRLL